MGFLSDKPYTAVTSTIEQLCSPGYEDDIYSGIINLVDIIKIQPTGPTEAARAIRKKLKYGSQDQQIRALTVSILLYNQYGYFTKEIIIN